MEMSNLSLGKYLVVFNEGLSVKWNGRYKCIQYCIGTTVDRESSYYIFLLFPRQIPLSPPCACWVDCQCHRQQWCWGLVFLVSRWRRYCPCYGICCKGGPRVLRGTPEPEMHPLRSSRHARPPPAAHFSGTQTSLACQGSEGVEIGIWLRKAAIWTAPMIRVGWRDAGIVQYITGKTI